VDPRDSRCRWRDERNGAAPGHQRGVRRDARARLGRPHALRAPAFALRLALGELADALLTGQRAVPARALALGFGFRHATLEPALRDLLRRPASRR
jgi:uncharacterized protein